MNSERKAFEKRFYKADWIIWDEVLGKYISKDPLCQTTIAYNHMFFVWQASAQRQGYKLVPVDVLERAISHISIAMCHPNNTRNEEDIMHNDMVIIEEAMNGELYD